MEEVEDGEDEGQNEERKKLIELLRAIDVEAELTQLGETEVQILVLRQVGGRA